MTTWTEGYVTEIDYSYAYFNELNPVRATMGLLTSQCTPPKIRHACELGFGQGLSINFHAAATDVEWWGTDFNPQQAAFAKDLSEFSGAHIFDTSFEVFCSRNDLPEFDFIVLHGIWSWISERNRHIICDFIHRKLSIGGIVYISYNTLPGWAAAAPLRELIANISTGIGSFGNTIERIETGLQFTEQFLATKPLWTRANPSIDERFDKLVETQSRNYLAHEYFNREWKPMYFYEVSEL